MDAASFGSTEGRGEWPASHRWADGGTIKQDDCDRDVSQMCRRAFAIPHAAYWAGKRARESYLCKSTLLGAVIATFFRVPTHSRRASRHSIGVEARHRWGLFLYRFIPSALHGQNPDFGGCNQVGAQGAQLDGECKPTTTSHGVKNERTLRSGGISDMASESSCDGRGREKVLEEASSLKPSGRRRTDGARAGRVRRVNLRVHARDGYRDGPCASERADELADPTGVPAGAASHGSEATSTSQQQPSLRPRPNLRARVDERPRRQRCLTRWLARQTRTPSISRRPARAREAHRGHERQPRRGRRR